MWTRKQFTTMGILQVYVKVKNVKFTFRWFYTAGNFTLILIPVNWSTRGTDLCDWEASLSSSSSWSQVKKNYIKKLAIFSFDLRSHLVTLRYTSLLLCLFIYSSWQWCQVRITFNWIVYLCIADKLSRPFGDGRKSNILPLAMKRESWWWKIRDYIKCLHIKRKAKCKTEKQTKGMSTAKQKWRAEIARTSPRDQNRFQAAFSCRHVFSLIHQTRKTSNFTVCSTGSVFITKVAFPWGTSCLKTSVKLWDICWCKTHKT